MATAPEQKDSETALPDESQFSVNERPLEYEAMISVEGKARIAIHAETPEDARQQAEAMVRDGDFELWPEDVDEARLDSIRKCRPMYRVMREGKKMQTSRLSEGDTPREPDEHGF